MRNPKKSSLVKTESVFFSELDYFMAFGYGKSKRDILCSDAIFVWPESIRSMLAKKHGRGKMKVMDEQLVLIDYLLERVLELWLEPSKDISTSSGWEKYLLSCS